MIFTREQFDQHIGSYCLDDFPFPKDYFKDKEFLFKLFNLLSNTLQAVALAYGGGDTEFREDLRKYLCRACYNLTVKQFYQAKDEIAKKDMNSILYHWKK